MPSSTAQALNSHPAQFTRASLTLGWLVLAGCAIYRPLPLDTGPPKPLSQLSVPASTLLPGGLTTHPFDPADGLDMTEISMLAVAQSPDLKVQRAQAQVTRAQAFAAGLLPDPVITLSRDRPSAGQAGASTAFGQGIAWDVGSLVTLAARRSASRRTDESVDLALLWSEWQTVAEARLRFTRIEHARELVARLELDARAMEPLAPRLRAALERGFISFDVATTGLAAASDVARQLADARANLATSEQDLRDLLGLRADEPLQLVGGLELPDISAGAVPDALGALPHRRPDLRALDLGYAAQESKTRAAVLGQFPALNVGVTRSRDNSNISSSGFTVSVSLPLFDRNRGNIRIERATRAQLREEYQQRLLTAHSDVARLLLAQQILLRRQTELAPHAAQLETAAARASQAYTAGLMDWTVYLALRQNALAAAVELNTLNRTLDENRIGLATLLGGTWSASPALKTKEP